MNVSIGGQGQESSKLLHLGEGDAAVGNAVVGFPTEGDLKDGVDEIGLEFRGDRGKVKTNKEPTSPGVGKHRAGG